MKNVHPIGTFAAIALCAISLLGFNGCAGYQLGAVKPSRLAAIQTLAIPTFENATFEPRIEVLVTNAVIKQFQQDGTYEIQSTENADAILKAKIAEIRRYRARSVQSNVVATREFVLQLRINYEVVSRASGEVLKTSSVTGKTSFFVGNDVQQDERQGIPLAAEEAAVELVSQISEGW